jgi:cell fate regulator YaaT (PSP1 superfamily)
MLDEIDAFLAAELALPDDAAWDEELELVHAAGVRLAPGRVIDADAGDMTYARGDVVRVELAPAASADAPSPSMRATGALGPVRAEVVVASRRLLVRSPVARIVGLDADVASASGRLGDAATLEAEAAARAIELRVVRAAREAIHQLGLSFKVLRAEARGDGRLVLFLAGEEKLPFLDLLRALTPSAGSARLELRQMGPRDAAKELGGIGPCGLQLCCNTFLADAPPVTLRMAREQGLAPAPLRVNGVCGRLLCCLMYEEAHYRAMKARVPHVGDEVTTPQGRGRVLSVDVLAMRVSVAVDGGGGEGIDVAISDLVPQSTMLT